MLDTEFGIDTDGSPDLRKARSPMCVTEFGIDINVKSCVFSNVASSIRETVLGISKDVSPEYIKALSPIAAFSLGFHVTVVRFSQYEKAKNPMLVTDSGITIDVNPVC